MGLANSSESAQIEEYNKSSEDTDSGFLKGKTVRSRYKTM